MRGNKRRRIEAVIRAHPHLLFVEKQMVLRVIEEAYGEADDLTARFDKWVQAEHLEGAGSARTPSTSAWEAPCAASELPS